MGNYRLDESGRDFIKGFEGLSLTPYNDANDGDTIGWGHLMRPGEDALYDGITVDQADQLFNNDVYTAESVVNKTITVPLKQNQFNALVSYAYNIGTGNFQAGDLVKLINKGESEEVIKKFWKGHWISDDGSFSNGLYNRRSKEADLFFSPITYHVKSSLPVVIIIIIGFGIIYLLKKI